MKTNNQQGIALPAIAIIIAILAALGGGTYYAVTKQSVSEETMMEKEGTGVYQDDSLMDNDAKFDTEDSMAEADAMMKEVDSAMAESSMEKDIRELEVMMDGESNFTGTILAGSLSKSPLLDYTKADFDKALSSNKLIVIYFYANWCPICKAEFPKAQAAFNQLQSNDAVGFRVNFNDNQTDSDEIALAKQHGVAYQHTKVFIKNGTRILKSPETWDTMRYLSEISKYK